MDSSLSVSVFFSREVSVVWKGKVFIQLHLKEGKRGQEKEEEILKDQKDEEQNAYIAVGRILQQPEAIF